MKIASLVAEGLKVKLHDEKRLKKKAVTMGIRREDLKSG